MNGSGGGGGGGSSGGVGVHPCVTALRLAARAFYLSPYDPRQARRRRGADAKSGALSVDAGVLMLVGAGPEGEHEAVLPSSSKALILAKAEEKSLVATGSIGALSVLGTGSVHPAGKRAQNEAEARAQLGKACVVVLDALCRTDGWVKEESIAKELRLSQRLVKRALRVLSLDHLVRREVVRPKALSDNDVKEWLRKQEAGRAGPSDGLLKQSQKRDESGWCRVDFPHAMEALKLKMKRMRDAVLRQLNDENLGRSLQCLNCGEQYSSLEARKLIVQRPPFLVDTTTGTGEEDAGTLYYPVRNHLEWPQMAGRLVVVEGGRRKRMPRVAGVDVFKRLDTLRKNRKMSEAMDTVCLRLGKKRSQPLERADLVALLEELMGDEGLGVSDRSYFRAMIATDLSYRGIARHVFAERVMEVVQLQKFVCTPHCAKLRDVRVRARSIDQHSKFAVDAARRIETCFAEVGGQQTGLIDYEQARQALVNAMPKVPGDEQRAFIVQLRQANPAGDAKISLKDLLLALQLLVVEIVGGPRITRPPRPAHLEGLGMWCLHYIEGVDDSENLYCAQCNGIVDFSDEHDIVLSGDLSGESSEEKRLRYQDILARLSEQLKPVFAQLDALGTAPVPDYGSLQQWREFKIREAELKKAEAEKRRHDAENGLFDAMMPQPMLFEPDSNDGVAVIIDDDDNGGGGGGDDANRGTNAMLGANGDGANGHRGNDLTVTVGDRGGDVPLRREVAPWEAARVAQRQQEDGAEAAATTASAGAREAEGAEHPLKKRRGNGVAEDDSNGVLVDDVMMPSPKRTKPPDDDDDDDEIDWED